MIDRLDRRGERSRTVLRRAARWLAVVFVAAASVAAAGCGYTLAGRGSFLPAYIHTIGIPPFDNHTSYFDVGQVFTQKVRSEFIGRGKFVVRPVTTGVDAVLHGSIKSITIAPASFSGQQQASRYVITVVAAISLYDEHAKKTLWQNPSMVFQENYEASSGTGALDPAAFFGQQTQALDRVSTDFAKTVVSSILEAF